MSISQAGERSFDYCEKYEEFSWAWTPTADASGKTDKKKKYQKKKKHEKKTAIKTVCIKTILCIWLNVLP